MEISLDEQLNIIKKQLKNDGYDNSSINSFLKSIKANYNKSKIFLYKKYQFSGVNLIGTVIGIDCFNELMLDNSFDINDTILICKMDNSKDIGFKWASDIVKEI